MPKLTGAIRQLVEALTDLRVPADRRAIKERRRRSRFGPGQTPSASIG